MIGKRWYRNYPAARKAWPQVSKAIGKRLKAVKTLCLGEVRQGSKDDIPYDDYAVFLMGATGKKNTTEYHPVDDHTRTGLNDATDKEPLRFSLASHWGVAQAFHNSYYMAVKDVSDAFPLVPLHPSLWRFMLFCWWYVGPEDVGDLGPISLWCLY